jgi:hypothetical protein
MTGPHLDDQQFAYYLLEKRLDAEGVRHLDACPLCREEFEWFTILISDFGADTLRWSDARVAGLVVKPSFRAREWRPVIKWATAACLLLAGLLAAMVAGHRTHHERANNGAIRLEQNSREQIASDNRVLTGVYQEINAPVTVPMQEYGFSHGEDPARRSKADSRVE